MSAKIWLLTDSGEVRNDCGPLLTIGRDQQNDIRIPDLKVSRNHAAIRTLGDGKHYVADMGSSNGTFVNGRRVVTTTPISDGDIITIGDHTLRYEGMPDVAAGAPPTRDDVNVSTIRTPRHKVMEITILVSDIKNYTQLSEQASEDLLAGVMGDWCSAVSDAAAENNGIVDKFVGDSVMIRWLAAKSGIAATVNAALKTAAAINDITASINDKYPELPAPLGIGVGINTGSAVLGNMGGSITRDYTALGDAVNLAYRIETATRALGVDILLAKNSYTHLPESMWKDRLHKVTVKGKARPVEVCAMNFADLA